MRETFNVLERLQRDYNRELALPERWGWKAYLLKPFSASIGKVEDFANDQQRFNRRIAVNKGTTATVTLISVVPKLQYVVAEPERNVPAIN